MLISNDEFLKAIFGAQFHFAHVTSFTEDPSAIPPTERGRCWQGRYYKDANLIPNSNQYFTVSLFEPDQGLANRRKVNFEACYVIALDDVREKLPIEQVSRLPPPSVVLKSSLHSEQWLYLLSSPERKASRIENLHDGLLANGLAPDGKDPGQKGVTRYLRLPEGVNTKEKRIAENGGVPPRCEVMEWQPERKYTLEQLAEPFGVDLDAPQINRKGQSTQEIPDHPLLFTSVIEVKRQRGGVVDIVCPWVEEHSDRDDSGTAMFTNADDIGFKCHHGNCVGRTGADLLNWIETHEPGFKERLKQWQIKRSFLEVGSEPCNQPAIAPPVECQSNQESALTSLLSMSANGKSAELEWKMTTDRFILKDLAILGQWTVFYAGPNTGKTLLVLWLLREAIQCGDIEGGDVFYANCDDTYKGGVEKLKIGETVGFNMLLPNINEFRPEVLLSTMDVMAKQGEATGKVVILDTLKKFTELMDKRIVSQFGKVAREFVGAGGSLICLAHVNKHKDSEGKSVYAGTSDIRDDCDCCWTIEQIGTSGITHTVLMENTKARGDVVSKASFQYSKVKGSGYVALLNSVRRVSVADVEADQVAAEKEKLREEDAEVIEQIESAMENRMFTKGDIEKFINLTSQTSRARVRTVLERYSGDLWDVERGACNALIYTLKTPTALEAVCFI